MLRCPKELAWGETFRNIYIFSLASNVSRLLKYIAISEIYYSWSNLVLSVHYVGEENHRMVWSPNPTLLMWSGVSSIRPGCWKPRTSQLWKLPVVAHPQLFRATCSTVLSSSSWNNGRKSLRWTLGLMTGICIRTYISLGVVRTSLSNV